MPDTTFTEQSDDNQNIESSNYSIMGNLGSIIMVIGIVMTFSFTFGFATSVDAGERSVVNIDLVQNRIVGIMISLSVAFLGLFLILTSVIIHLLQAIITAVITNKKFIK